MRKEKLRELSCGLKIRLFTFTSDIGATLICQIELLWGSSGKGRMLVLFYYTFVGGFLSFFFFFFFSVDRFLKSFEFLTILLLFYVLIFWPHGMWDLSSPSDVEPTPPALRSPNYWTTWEVPTFLLLSKNMSHDRNSYLTVDYQVPVDRVAVCSLAQESTRVEIYRAHTSCRVLFIILS